MITPRDLQSAAIAIITGVYSGMALVVAVMTHLLLANIISMLCVVLAVVAVWSIGRRRP